MNKNIWRAVIEVGFIIFLFYSVFRITARECAADIAREFERGLPVIFRARTY